MATDTGVLPVPPAVILPMQITLALTFCGLVRARRKAVARPYNHPNGKSSEDIIFLFFQYVGVRILNKTFNFIHNVFKHFIFTGGPIIGEAAFGIAKIFVAEQMGNCFFQFLCIGHLYQRICFFCTVDRIGEVMHMGADDDRIAHP